MTIVLHIKIHIYLLIMSLLKVIATMLYSCEATHTLSEARAYYCPSA